MMVRYTFCLIAGMFVTTVTSQVNNFRIPPGALVEFEVEYVNPFTRQGGAGSQPGMMSPMMQMSPPPMTSAGAPTSGVQRLLSSMTQIALNLRRFYGIRSPLPPMEEPCPCDAECCSRPMEPRRLIPVMELPMVTHRGCCGCVDCPLSLSPAVAYMIQGARQMSRPRIPTNNGGETRK